MWTRPRSFQPDLHLTDPSASRQYGIPLPIDLSRSRVRLPAHIVANWASPPKMPASVNASPRPRVLGPANPKTNFLSSGSSFQPKTKRDLTVQHRTGEWEREKAEKQCAQRAQQFYHTARRKVLRKKGKKQRSTRRKAQKAGRTNRAAVLHLAVCTAVGVGVVLFLRFTYTKIERSGNARDVWCRAERGWALLLLRNNSVWLF